ncbi:DUF4283 domain protein [Medicago truncatula]|uniref:DUF4283 domain protein n=1 Tax=Medicago truncatula TaxID=3880 RepID=G7K1B6_MEDTR|nr:DUF4283 domain protein [Medicago truncatula]
MSSLWPNLKNSNIVPLCKGFFALLFNTVKEMQKLWSLRLLNLKLGILRFSCWTKDFHPSKQKLLHAQVWIQIMNLPQEHWRPTFLFEITSSLGTPLFPLMNPQKNRLFVHYARVLVDICLYVGIVFEKYPLYCKNCGVIGPSIQKCKRLDAKIADGCRGKATTVDYSIGNVTDNIMMIQSNLANIANEPITFNLNDRELSAMASSSLLSKDGMNSYNSDNPICFTISGAIPNQDVLVSSPKSAPFTRS